MKGFSLSKIFARFAPKDQQGISVPFHQIKHVFSVGHEGYRPSRDMLHPICANMDWNRVQRIGDTRTLEAKPGKRYYLNEDDDHSYRGSDLIAYHDYKTVTGKHAFGLIIRAQMTNRKEFDLPIAFGIAGFIDEKDQFRITKLFLPEMNGRDQTGVFTPPMTRENVLRALAYASLCSKQILAGQKMDVYGNMLDAERKEPSEILYSRMP